MASKIAYLEAANGGFEVYPDGKIGFEGRSSDFVEGKIGWRQAEHFG